MNRWECTVCSYIHTGDAPPDECPVCSADKNLFTEAAEEPAPSGISAEPEETDSPDQQPARPPSRLAGIYTMASELTARHHLHPIAVHTPNGVIPMALVFMAISAWFGAPHFETAALYSLVFVLISMPLVLFTGYSMWRQRYLGAWTGIFKIKIGASIATVVLLAVLVIWRIVQPDILASASTGRWIFWGGSVLLVCAAGVAGHYGGKLVFATRKN